MSEQRLKDFAERAETRVRLPHFAQLENRGRDLRRTRLAVSGVVAALVLVTSGIVATIADDLRTAPPAEDPAPTEIQELDSRPFDYHQELTPGVKYSFRPFSLDTPSPVSARLTAPERGWVWWGDGLTKPRHGYAGLFPTPRKPYATVGVVLADRVATTQCRTYHTSTMPRSKPEWDELSPTPLTAARQLARVPGTTVRKSPGPDARFGLPGAHVQLSVPRLCPETQDHVLWSLEPAMYGGDPGVGLVRYPGQVVDVWVVDVKGTLVLVYQELSPGLPAAFAEEGRALVNSIRLEPVGQ